MTASKKLLSDLLWKGIPGAVGGAIAWVFSLSPEGRHAVVILWPEEWYVSLPMFIVLGTIAALAFFEVLNRIDRANLTTVLVLATLAGMSWSPVIGRITNTQMALVRAQEATGTIADTLDVLSEFLDVASREPDSEDKEAYAEQADRLATGLIDTTLDVARGGGDDIQDSVGRLLAGIASRATPNSQLQIAHRLEDGGWNDVEGTYSQELEDNRLVFLGVPEEISMSAVRDVSYRFDEETPLVFAGSEEIEVIGEFAVDQTGDYTLNVSSPDQDLVAGIFGANRFVLAVDDDGGEELAPCITTSLDEGTYYLRVTQFAFEEPVPRFTATLSRDRGCQDTG